MYEKYESIYVEIMIMPRVKKEADFVLKKVRRPKIIFWRSAGQFTYCPLEIKCVILKHKTVIDDIFSITQETFTGTSKPHGMVHGQHPDLKMEMDGMEVMKCAMSHV